MTTIDIASPDLFESFNARTLAPHEVAATFIAPTLFEDLAKRCHSTVSGPRGSGKTSLLKMLHPHALEVWPGDTGTRYRAKINYTGVFIPTDSAWNQQTVAFVKGLPIHEQRLLRGAAFTTQVLHAVIDVCKWRTTKGSSGVAPFRRVSLTRDDEREMVRLLASNWQLKVENERLLSLKHALSARNSDIWKLAQSRARDGKPAEPLPDWLGIEFLAAAKLAVEVFDDLVGENEGRWCLLFDELELAPDWILHGLLSAVRSTTEKFIFKLAVSPYNERYETMQNALGAMPQNDYNDIHLWYENKEDGAAFSDQLFVSFCRGRGLPIAESTDLLGHSPLDPNVPGRAKPYSKASRQYAEFMQALREDKSFRRYWRTSGINVEQMAELSSATRASRVRKIYPQLVVRNFFRRGGNATTRQTIRSRKSLDIYGGSNSVLAITEGNPRWIIGLAQQMLKTLPLGETKVDFAIQSACINDAIHAFRARLACISIDPLTPYARETTLMSFLDVLGAYFTEQSIGPDFHTDPNFTFYVDPKSDKAIHLAVGRALNVGALVYVPSEEDIAMINKTEGKRFRLCYLLACDYCMPLRLGPDVSISRILRLSHEDVLEKLPLFSRKDPS